MHLYVACRMIDGRSITGLNSVGMLGCRKAPAIMKTCQVAADCFHRQAHVLLRALDGVPWADAVLAVWQQRHPGICTSWQRCAGAEDDALH
jgi:hypothetical protein